MVAIAVFKREICRTVVECIDETKVAWVCVGCCVFEVAGSSG